MLHLTNDSGFKPALERSEGMQDAPESRVRLIGCGPIYITIGLLPRKVFQTLASHRTDASFHARESGSHSGTLPGVLPNASMNARWRNARQTLGESGLENCWDASDG